MHRITCLLFGISALALLAGCGRAPDAPSTVLVEPGLPTIATTTLTGHAVSVADDGGFVDLAVGNHAEATRVFRMRTITSGHPDPEWITLHSQWQRTIEGVEPHGERMYFAERSSFVEEGGNHGEFTDLEREDRTGMYLYQADVPATESAGSTPATSLATQALASLDARLMARGLDVRQRAAFAAAAATVCARVEAARAAGAGAIDPGAPPIRRAAAARGGIAAHEITLLRYPLRPGASWDGRVGFNVWTVEAREPLRLPAGHFAAVRLRVDLPGTFGPSDRYTTWYGAPGELAHDGHFESIVTGDNGDVLGTIESEDVQQLTLWAPAPRR